MLQSPVFTNSNRGDGLSPSNELASACTCLYYSRFSRENRPSDLSYVEEEHPQQNRMGGGEEMEASLFHKQVNTPTHKF